MVDDDNAALLALLNAHCSQALGRPEEDTRERKRRRLNSSVEENESEREYEESEDDSEEWGGINFDAGENDDEDDEETIFSGVEDIDDLDDDFRAESTSLGSPNVIVFSENRQKSSLNDKSQMKAFMSSKVSKLRGDEATNTSSSKRNAKEDEEERTNRENDALLHKLVHTKLLSGSLDRSLDMKSADRRKAMAGRVMELAGGAKLGKGEKIVRHEERNKASKRVREGLIEKQKHVLQLQKEEAKNLGNYHPSLKRLFEDEPKSSKPKRDRGLRMGVGKFSGGVLKLKDADVHKVIGRQQRGTSRNKLGGRGKNKGRL